MISFFTLALACRNVRCDSNCKAFRKVGENTLSRVLMVIILLAFSQNSFSQIRSDDDVLGFLPAILAGKDNNSVDTIPSQVNPPETPNTGSGNYRFVQTEVFRRVNPTGKISTLKSTWDAAGNNNMEELMSFGVFSGNPSAVIQTVTVNKAYNSKNQPLTVSSLFMFQNGTTGAETKEYKYAGNGRLNTTISNFTSANQTSNTTTEFKYTNNKLSSAIVTAKTNGITTNVERHSLIYNNKQRVKTQRVVRITASSNASEETVHIHQYNNSGNLTETVSVSPSVEITRSFLPFVGNTRTIKTVVINSQTNTTVDTSDVVITYAAGACNLRGPNDSLVIEANITASMPYSPNAGCIKR